MTCKKAEARQGKIYVGKLPPGDALSKEDIQAHFAQSGEVCYRYCGNKNSQFERNKTAIFFIVRNWNACYFACKNVLR